MGWGSRIRDLRSGIRKNLVRIPNPGVKKGPGSRIRIRNTVQNSRYLDFISAGLAEEVDVLGVLLLQALNHTTLQSHGQK
jgi:hypothetical protein